MYAVDKETVTSKRMIESIISYVNFYVDTSFKKDARIEAAMKGATICQHICIMYPLDTVADRLIYNSFLNLAENLTKASVDRNTLYDFENELGFLKILNSNVSE